jgi:esterase/lipase superfamily enzyme
MNSSLKEPVEYNLNEICIMKHLAERRQKFIYNNNGGAVVQVSLTDDAEEHVRSVGSVALVAEFINHKNVQMHVKFKNLLESPALYSAKKIPDQFVGAHKTRLETVLDGAIPDGHSEVHFASAGWT